MFELAISLTDGPTDLSSLINAYFFTDDSLITLTEPGLRYIETDISISKACYSISGIASMSNTFSGFNNATNSDYVVQQILINFFLITNRKM